MSGLIPSEVVAEVLSRTDIVELIGGYLPLSKAGRSFKALCPFHQEKTPSFMVNPDRQIFHCFGCGEGGDAARFLMRREGFSFPEAVEFLAQRAGIPLPRRRGGGREQEDGRLRLYEIQRAASEYFRQSLQGTAGEAARAALAARGIRPETIERFQLGYAPEAWEGLVRFLTQRGFPARLMEGGGLVVPRPGGNGHYDRFRDRLMIPIQDPAGKILGFGGRALGAQEPKYLNSPETPIYRKGQHLFGLPVAARALREGGRAIVVEGYFDCIVLQQAGIGEAVGVLGTALTREQALLLRRYVDGVILVFDPDRAGQEAAWRGLELAMEVGLEASVVTLPEGTDPDAFVRKEGAEPFRVLLAAARDLVDFVLTAGKGRAGPEGPARSTERILGVLARLPDGIRRTRYVQKLAERLGVPEQAVLADLARATAGRTVRAEAPAPGATRPAVGPEEKLLLQLLLLFPVVRERVRREPPEVEGEACRAILEVLVGPEGRDEVALTRALVHHPREDVQRLASELLVADPGKFPEPTRMLQDCLKRMHVRAERPRLRELRREIDEAEQRGDREAVARLQAEFQDRARRAG
ncbi:MAG: DNA primase [candidate division NC10 bacterium]|nr:DNA primase [candidate division NC10 bacterium]